MGGDSAAALVTASDRRELTPHSVSPAGPDTCGRLRALIRSLGALRGASPSERWMMGAQVVRGRMPPPVPGSGYAPSIGELAEGPILRRDYPGARSAPPKFGASEVLTTEGTKANPYTVVTQTYKGGRWISISVDRLPDVCGIGGLGLHRLGGMSPPRSTCSRPSDAVPVAQHRATTRLPAHVGGAG